jgi:pentose-5-phosphate-3-epimerase
MISGIFDLYLKDFVTQDNNVSQILNEIFIKIKKLKRNQDFHLMVYFLDKMIQDYQHYLSIFLHFEISLRTSATLQNRTVNLLDL